MIESGRRGSNPQLSAWEADTLPLSYARTFLLTSGKFSKTCQSVSKQSYFRPDSKLSRFKIMSTNFFNIDTQDIEILRQEWCELALCYTSDNTSIQNAFQILYERYSERHRLYHNLSHVKTLLSLCRCTDSLEHYNAIRFAIWFHDVIYSTQRQDNEDKSADLAAQMLSVCRVDSTTIKYVQSLIMATKKHSDKGLPADGRLFLDMDLAILGADEKIYAEYRKAIRGEYCWVPEFLYRRSRRKVLQAFQNRESIYFTERMKAQYEVRARANIAAELGSI